MGEIMRGFRHAHAASLSAREEKAALNLVCVSVCVNVHNILKCPLCFCVRSLHQMSVCLLCIPCFFSPPSCYSVTAGCVAMATAILERATLFFPNCRLKENEEGKTGKFSQFAQN